MQMGEVVAFNEYGNYIRNQRTSDRQKKRNRKISRMKMRLLRVTVIVLFFVIVYIFALMLDYVIRNSFTEKNENSGFANTVDASDSNDYHSESDLDWQLILVNKDNPVPDDYEVELTTLSNGVQVDSRVYPDLQKMFDDMRNEGIYPVVSEGYRTHEQQEKMMQDKIDAFMAEGYSKKAAKHMALEWVAKPGTSEHELGIALDINASANSQTTHEEVYQWLNNNAHRYGFILRYPEGKESITGIDYEPWHYRYVGEKAAREIYESGLTLEEYEIK